MFFFTCRVPGELLLPPKVYDLSRQATAVATCNWDEDATYSDILGYLYSLNETDEKGNFKYGTFEVGTLANIVPPTARQ